MKFYIPQNLNIEELIKEHPPQIKQFDKWNLLYFVHLVTYLPSISKKLRHAESGYVNLYSVSMQDVVPNYNDYIAYLVSHDVLQVNTHYLPGAFSRSYRLSFHYAGRGFTSVEIENNELSRKATKQLGMTDEERKKVNTEYYHLVRQFEGLEYDFEAATKYIGNMLIETLKLPGYYDEKYVSDRIREIQINNQLLKDREFQCKVDSTSGRFHSVLTRLKKEFRHFLKYKGQPLVSLDVKCSQPYIAQRLLMPEFWLEPAGGTREKPGRKKQRTQAQIDSSKRLEKFLGGDLREILGKVRATWGLRVGEVEDRLTEEVIEGLRKVKDTSPMLVSKIQLTDNQSVMRFSNLVNQEDIYAYILDVLSAKLMTDSDILELYNLAPFSLDRNSMKVPFLRGLYSPSRSKHPTSRLMHKVFEEEFQGAETVFNHIKNKRGVQFRILALLLQAVESEIILKRVCKKVIHKNHRIPLFTIHDSILTIPRFKDVVAKVMEEEFEKAISVKPRIKEESYDILDMKPIASVLMKTEADFVSIEDIQLEERRYKAKP